MSDEYILFECEYCCEYCRRPIGTEMDRDGFLRVKFHRTAGGMRCAGTDAVARTPDEQAAAMLEGGA